MASVRITFQTHRNFQLFVLHRGHAKRSMTPTGNGFDTFTGIYMWDNDNWSKQMYSDPLYPPLMIDWVRELKNGNIMVIPYIFKY